MPTNFVRPNLDPNFLAPMVILKEFFEKFDSGNNRQTKKRAKRPLVFLHVFFSFDPWVFCMFFFVCRLLRVNGDLNA